MDSASVSCLEDGPVRLKGRPGWPTRTLRLEALERIGQRVESRPFKRVVLLLILFAEARLATMIKPNLPAV